MWDMHSFKSWSFKGERPELKSIAYASSILIISGISSDNLSFFHLQSNSIYSIRFIKFLSDLNKSIQTKWRIKKKRTINLLLGYASSHTTKKK